MGDDGHCYAPCCVPYRRSLKNFLVVVEELRHGILCAHVLLHLEEFHVHLYVGCLLMLLRIGCHGVGELRAGVLYRRRR